MNRLLFFFCIFCLTLGSCGILPAESGTETAGKFATIPTTDIPPVTPASTQTPQVPTTPPTIHPSETPQDLLQPTVTEQAPLDTFYLPALEASKPLTITQISMINAENGWAIGHQKGSGDRILYTQDGGYSWEGRTPPILRSSDQNAGLFQAWGYFQDRETAWVIYLPQDQPPPIQAPVTWRTSDGGQTWEISEQLPISGAESYFIPEEFSFIDKNQGWLLVHIDAGMGHDYSNLFATSDGGITWQRLIDPYGEGLQSLHNTGLAFADPEFGWVTKDNLAVMPGAFIEQTRDGGHSWEDIFLPAPEELDWSNEISQCATSDPIFIEADEGIILVNCHTFEDKTFTYTFLSSDKGQSWRSAPIPTTVQSLFFINSQIGWAFGRDLYQSTDGGLSWVKIKTVNWDGQFSFVDEKSGWAVATAGEALALVFTHDGGKTWELINPMIR